MSVSVKRSVHVHVNMDASFRKNYILLLNKLMEDLNYKISSYKLSMSANRGEASFGAFITQKLNEILLQVDQLKQKIDDVKRCKDGELFLLSTLDGQVELSEGDDLLSAIGPVSIQADGSKITKIIA